MALENLPSSGLLCQISEKVVIPHAVTCPPSAPIVSSALPGGRALLSSVYLASPCLLSRFSLVVFAAGSLPAGTFRPGTRPMANSTRLCTPTQPTS